MIQTNLWLLGERIGEGLVRDLEMDMNTLLYLKRITNKILVFYYITQGTLLRVMWQPGWGEVWENRYMYVYGLDPLLSTGNYHNIVNWLCSNIR